MEKHVKDKQMDRVDTVEQLPELWYFSVHEEYVSYHYVQLFEKKNSVKSCFPWK